MWEGMGCFSDILLLFIRFTWSDLDQDIRFTWSDLDQVYAAYGGVFVIFATLWGWLIEGKFPDRFDLVGGAFYLVGVILSIRN